MAGGIRTPSPRPGLRGLSRAGAVTILLATSSMLPGRGALAAQEPAVAEMHGRVVYGEEGVASAMVTLHRVSPTAAGPVDSTRTGRDGGFQVRLPQVPDPGLQELYFASVRHEGVTYFGPAIQMAAQLDSLYTIAVYETEEAPAAGAALPLAARFTLLEEREDGNGWSATDLLNVLNPGERTLVGVQGGVTFAYPLPEGATDLEVGGEGTPEDAATLEAGALRVTAAIPPGQREFVVRYRLPDPFVTLRYPGTTAEVEFLVKEPAPPLDVDGLEALEAVELEPGTRYRRYAAAGLRDTVVTVTEGESPPVLPVRWLAVALAMLLTVATLVVILRRPDPAPPGVSGPGLSPFERRQALLLEVARLDEARDTGEIVDEEAWAGRRRALIERLRDSG